MKLGDHVETYCHSAVSANNRNMNGRSQREVVEFLSDKSGSTDDVQGGDTEQPETKVGLVSG